MTLAFLDDFRDEDELDAVEHRRLDVIDRERIVRRLRNDLPEPRVIVRADVLERAQTTRKRLHLVTYAQSERPRTRGDCVDGPRPCPYVTCTHHLAIEVTHNGGIKALRPDIFDADGVPDLERLSETCVLDVADRVPEPDEIRGLLNISQQLVDRITERALKKLEPLLAKLREE